MVVKTGTLIAVYHGDRPEAFAVALDSIIYQRLSADVEMRIYLAVDGPVSASMEDVINARRFHIHRIVRLPVNKGLAAALNMLIEALEDEEYLFRMDADDWSEPHRYQAQLDYLFDHPEIDILGTDIIEVDQSIGRTRRISYALDHKHALSALCRRVPVAHPTVCFRRRVLDITGGYPKSGTNEDISLWFRCAKEGFVFGNLHEPLLRFNIGPGFWNRRNVKKAFSEFKCYAYGIWSMEGVTWKYLYPALRFAVRLLPSRISRILYATKMRQSKSARP